MIPQRKGGSKGLFPHFLPCLRMLYFYLGLWGRKGVYYFSVWIDNHIKKLNDAEYETLACPKGVLGETNHLCLCLL